MPACSPLTPLQPRFRSRLAGLLLIGLAAATVPAAAATLALRLSDDAGKPLVGAVVFLESKEARAASRPAAGVEVVQMQRQFTPAVSVVQVGTAVSFPNRDTVRHHVYSFSPTKRFEIKLYVGTPAAPVVFDTPGIGVLGCNIHDNMSAWMVVVETPYHGISGADGQVLIDRVPAGHYRLRSWHPSLPAGAAAFDQPLQLPATPGSLSIDLKLNGARS